MLFRVASVLSCKFVGQRRTEIHVSWGIVTGTSQAAVTIVLGQEQKIY